MRTCASLVHPSICVESEVAMTGLDRCSSSLREQERLIENLAVEPHETPRILERDGDQWVDGFEL